jgi:hypothetical protein
MAGSPPRQRRSTAKPIRISTIGRRMAKGGRNISGTRPNASIDLANVFGLDSLIAPAQRNSPPKSQGNVVLTMIRALLFKVLLPSGGLSAKLWGNGLAFSAIDGEEAN